MRLDDWERPRQEAAVNALVDQPPCAGVARANSSTANDGDALIGISPKPRSDGNANCKIRLVPAKAIPNPAAPPHSDSRILSISG